MMLVDETFVFQKLHVSLAWENRGKKKKNSRLHFKNEGRFWGWYLQLAVQVVMMQVDFGRQNPTVPGSLGPLAVWLIPPHTPSSPSGVLRWLFVLGGTD